MFEVFIETRTDWSSLVTCCPTVPNGRHEQRALNALPPGIEARRMKDGAVTEGRVSHQDLLGNRHSHVAAANPGVAEHGVWSCWDQSSKLFVNVGALVGPKLRQRPEYWPPVRLPATVPELVPESGLPERILQAAAFEVGPDIIKRVVEHAAFAG
eukprot:4242777-Amphidinium_carterae.1